MPPFSSVNHGVFVSLWMIVTAVGGWLSVDTRHIVSEWFGNHASTNSMSFLEYPFMGSGQKEIE